MPGLSAGQQAKELDMTTHSLDVMVPAPVTSPRGARGAAALALWLGAAVRQAWSAAVVMGGRRAATQLRRLAQEQRHGNPERAAQLCEAASHLEASSVAEVRS